MRLARTSVTPCSVQARGRQPYCKNMHRDLKELLKSTQLSNLLKKAAVESSQKCSQLLPAFQPLPAYSAAFRHLDTQKPSTRIAWLLVYGRNRKALSTFPVHTILFALLTLHPYLR